MTSRIRRLLSRLLNAVWPQRSEPDLAREMAAHLTLMEDAFVGRGMTPEEARIAARRAFGGVERTKELHRDARSFPWLDDARRDLRHAVRLLRRDPLFATTAALSLAIGIGANTTIFTVVNALLFQPPPGVVEPHRLVDIGSNRRGGDFGPSSYPNYLDIRQRTTTVDGVYAYSRFPEAISLGSAGTDVGADSIFGSVVSVNYFTVLGAVPAVGRLFGAGDSEHAGASPIVVLSHGLWTRRFNKDPTIVGRTLTLNRQPFTVVGVASEGFHGTGVRAGDVWVPVTMVATVNSRGTATLTDRAAGSLLIGGRLKPGVSVSRATAEMAVIGRALEAEYPEPNRGTGLRLLASSPVPGNGGPIVAFLALLTVIVSLVLVIACANVAGVLLARATARRQEIALRLAIGAGRARLVRQLLTETVLLFVLGGAAGLVLARGMTSLLVSLLPALPFAVDLSLTLDSRVFAFTIGLSLMAALLSGLAPALQASKTDVLPGLRDDAAFVGRLRLRHIFVIGQVAFSIVLIIGAGLFMRALQRAASIDPGFDPHGVELASLDLAQAGYTDATGPRFARELLDRVRELPDVQTATIASSLPGGFEVRREPLTVPGVPPPNGQRFFIVDWNIVEPGYFATLRTPIAAGRDFTIADRDGTQPVALVSEAAARQFWPGQDAVGKYLLQPTNGPHGPTGPMRSLLVIGVARDVQFSTLIDGLARSCVYVPLPQQYLSGVTIVARTTHGQRIAEELRALLASMNPNLPIGTAQTLEDSVALGLAPQRVAASVSGSLGIVGLLLAGIGIYGVTAYAVARRTREIGIRVALGARRADVIGMVVREGLSLTLIGSAVGLVFAAAISRVLAGFLFGIPPLDPVTFTGTTVLFAAIGLAACYVPVRRAMHIDPTQALRYE
jgi:predicted permease